MLFGMNWTTLEHDHMCICYKMHLWCPDNNKSKKRWRSWFSLMCPNKKDKEITLLLDWNRGSTRLLALLILVLIVGRMGIRKIHVIANMVFLQIMTTRITRRCICIVANLVLLLKYAIKIMDFHLATSLIMVRITLWVVFEVKHENKGNIGHSSNVGDQDFYNNIKHWCL